MQRPIVVFAIFASGSICHHWQSLHIPHSDAAIATAPSCTVRRATLRVAGTRPRTAVRAFPRPSRPARPIQTLTSLRSPSNIHTAALASPAPMVGDGSRADDVACGGSHGRAGAAKTRLKMNGGPAMTINLRRETHQVAIEKIVTTSGQELCRLFVIFGEHQVMAQLIAKRVLISPLINKDFSRSPPSPCSGQLCFREPESPKVTKTRRRSWPCVFPSASDWRRPMTSIIVSGIPAGAGETCAFRRLHPRPLAPGATIVLVVAT
jgi:hypothetical protein